MQQSHFITCKHGNKLCLENTKQLRKLERSLYMILSTYLVAGKLLNVGGYLRLNTMPMEESNVMNLQLLQRATYNKKALTMMRHSVQ